LAWVVFVVAVPADNHVHIFELFFVVAEGAHEDSIVIYVTFVPDLISAHEFDFRVPIVLLRADRQVVAMVEGSATVAVHGWRHGAAKVA
jgi:hypothetical protein